MPSAIEVPLGKLQLTLTEAASRQVDAAIDALIAGNFDIALTLAGAAEGPQIPAETIERIFEPYTREDLRPSQQGLGLGLYIASEIAKAHSGVLSAKSSPAETRFSFLMPIASGVA